MSLTSGIINEKTFWSILLQEFSNEKNLLLIIKKLKLNDKKVSLFKYINTSSQSNQSTRKEIQILWNISQLDVMQFSIHLLSVKCGRFHKFINLKQRDCFWLDASDPILIVWDVNLEIFSLSCLSLPCWPGLYPLDQAVSFLVLKLLVERIALSW